MHNSFTTNEYINDESKHGSIHVCDKCRNIVNRDQDKQKDNLDKIYENLENDILQEKQNFREQMQTSRNLSFYLLPHWWYE